MSGLVTQHSTLPRALGSLAILLLAAGCSGVPAAAPPDALQPVSASARPLAAPAQPCGAFVAHALEHITMPDPSAALHMFESNGAGLAIGDLDDDGDLDLVLANLAGPNAILWNEGRLTFRREELSHGDSRAAAVVDVDGDGRLDLVFTRRLGPPTYWRNTGPRAHPRFEIAPLPGVFAPAYSMAWGDMDADGDLDLVAGSYDAALQQMAMVNPTTPFGGGAGIYLYERQDDRFAPTQLAAEAQALALALPDLDADGKLDILVGNDFDTPDYVWLRRGDAWNAATLFESTTRNTMSFDLGDIDNDGSPELFAADMKPYDQSVRVLAAWLPMMARMPRPASSAGPQINENALQVRAANGRFRNEAYARGIDATGWSWSARFGDLDRDGLLDLYVVNGMIDAELFGHLPGGELVEQNQALRNRGGAFARAPEWGVGATEGGRGMNMADLDDDGDLEIVVNNLGAPSRLFENRLCGGESLEVDLRWPASRNTRALGAQLALHTSHGTFYRDARAISGYLSGEPSRVHFGLPAGAALQRLEIRWPDGEVSHVTELAPHTLVTVTR